MTGHFSLSSALILLLLFSGQALFAEEGEDVTPPPAQTPVILKKVEPKPKPKVLDGVAKLKCRSVFEKEAESLHLSTEHGSYCTVEDKKSSALYSLAAKASDTSLSYNFNNKTIITQQRSVVSGQVVAKMIKLNDKCQVENVTLRDSYFKDGELVIDKQICVPTLNNYRYLKMNPGLKTKLPGISDYLIKIAKEQKTEGYIEYNDFYENNCLKYENLFYDKNHIEGQRNVLPPPSSLNSIR